MEVYKVFVRGPNEVHGKEQEDFRHVREAKEWIKEMAPSYEEGTLLYIVWENERGTSGGVEEIYVIEGGELRRKTDWVPHTSSGYE